MDDTPRPLTPPSVLTILRLLQWLPPCSALWGTFSVSFQYLMKADFIIWIKFADFHPRGDKELIEPLFYSLLACMSPQLAENSQVTQLVTTIRGRMVSAVFHVLCCLPPLGKAAAIHLSVVPRAQNVRVKATRLYFQFQNSHSPAWARRGDRHSGNSSVTTSPVWARPSQALSWAWACLRDSERCRHHCFEVGVLQ